MICFKTLKNFAEFTSQIEARFKYFKEEVEILEEFQLNFSTDDLIEEEHIEDFEIKEKEEESKKKKVGRPRKNPPKPPRVIPNIEKYNETFTIPYKQRRVHALKDEEGEQKIKNLVDVKCHECGIPFEKFIDVSRHFRLAHPKIDAYLICCDKKFTKRANLLEHVEFHDKSRIYRCEECDRVFKGKSILRNHLRKFHVEVQEPVVCPECGKLFSNKYTLKTHMKNHFVDETKLFECYICKKAAKNHEKLLQHFKYTHDPVHCRKTICHICSTIVTRLDIHLNQVHAEEPIERVRCDICGHNLKRTSLRGHMR